MKRVLIIGGGASGMMAAISAAKKGAQVTIYEKSDRIGKKILATGNGKCNLSNTNMDLSNYYTEDVEKLSECFDRFTTKDTVHFFENHGLMIRQREGYLYPYCEQASVVLDVLRSAVEKQKVKVETSVEKISVFVKKNGIFAVDSSCGKREFDSVILACGSKAGIKNATTEGYDYAKQFGHRIVSLQPALVQLRCEGDFFKTVAGVRCKAKIHLYSNKEQLAWEQGELQLTDYGISGIPVFQLSRIAARELQNKCRVEVVVDFLPDISKQEWNQYAKERIRKYFGCSCEDFLTGMLHKKISAMFLKEFGLKPQDLLDAQTKNKLLLLCNAMKDFCVTVKATNSYEQAQVCCGGVDFTELDENLQSVYQPGLFVCGEMVDIDGKCGGYNLQWAWTSGYIAGTTAAIGRK